MKYYTLEEYTSFLNQKISSHHSPIKWEFRFDPDQSGKIDRTKITQVVSSALNPDEVENLAILLRKFYPANNVRTVSSRKELGKNRVVFDIGYLTMLLDAEKQREDEKSNFEKGCFDPFLLLKGLSIFQGSATPNPSPALTLANPSRSK